MVPSAEPVTTSEHMSKSADVGILQDEIQPISSPEQYPEDPAKAQPGHEKISRPFRQSHHQYSRNTTREHSQKIRQLSSQRGQHGSKQTSLSTPYTSSQGRRNVVERYSIVAQQGSSHSADRSTSPVIKYDGSVSSNHDSSSHFANVRSFNTNVSENPRTDHSQSTLNRIPDDARGGNDPIQSREGPSASPVVPNYSSSMMVQTSTMPAGEFQTPPLLRDRRNSPNDRASAHEMTEMHTPSLQRRTGSGECVCDNSTPMPGHTPQTQQTFMSEGVATDVVSPAPSPIRRLEDTQCLTANNDTSCWDADKTGDSS